MSYVDVSVAAVPKHRKDEFIGFSKKFQAAAQANGALACVDTWGEDVPDGKLTDFKKAVQAKDDEVVAVGWVIWPDKSTHDKAWEKLMADETMKNTDMPFDGKRMIFGAFGTVAES